METYQNNGQQKQCPICGAMMPSSASFCPTCGQAMNVNNFYANSPQRQAQYSNMQNSGSNEDKSLIYGILALLFTVLGISTLLGFIFAIIGLTRPGASKSTKVLCWVSIAIGIMYVIIIIIWIAFVMNNLGDFEFEQTYPYVSNLISSLI